MVFLDNCNAEQLSSNVLAQIITESTVMTRLLGQSKMVPLTTNAFIVLTGNALRISEDLARRVLGLEPRCRCENPEQRSFNENFSASIREHRGRPARSRPHYLAQGRQASFEPGMPLGGFDQWASWCRDPLLSAGLPGPGAAGC
jgi:hypothetical protein